MCMIVHSKHMQSCDSVTSFLRSVEVKLWNEFIKCVIFPLILVLWMWYVLLTYSKVDMGNSEVKSDLTSDLSFKVNLHY